MRLAQRIWIVHCLVIAAALTPSIAEQTPDVIVERIMTVGKRSVRVALFSNRMAVTTVSESGAQVYQRKMQLDEKEYMGYLAAVNRDAEAVAKSSPKNLVGQGTDDAMIWVLTQEGGLAEVKFSPSTVFDLPLARLNGCLDDLELRLAEVSPNIEQLRQWNPAVGDVIELQTGGKARVTNVSQEGFITVDHLDVSVVQTIPLESCSKVILRVVEKPE